MQFLATFIMKGRMQAMMVASTLALLSLLFPPVSIVSSATVALVTLRLGAKAGFYVLLCSGAAAAVLSTLILGGYQFALVYGLVLWLPVWLIAIILRVGRKLVVTLELAVLLGMAAVLGFYSLQDDPVQFWGGLLMAMMRPMLDSQPDVSPEMVQHSADMFAHVMTGAVAAGSVFGLLFGVFLARWWQANLYNPGGFRIEYLALRGHRSLAVFALLLLAVANLGSGQIADIAWNLLIVLLVLYTFIGCAVLHSLFANGRNSRLWLSVFYITLVAIPHVMLLVAVCGLVDTWLDLRNKFKPSGA
ncbi:hypothetical protein KEF85_07065 [Methylomonas paludis]|uniref:DUF2232 domain-containing protein n=1 Tax=Methylomonas paludis TaxID=1173101 RepID=A0A975MQJ6_9GAMM|nr:hypothetical protein [Methylomonas paludis]QWF72203.1 hypothetical protein KEF85_07065 [Methylomonas paludis]